MKPKGFAVAPLLIMIGAVIAFGVMAYLVWQSYEPASDAVSQNTNQILGGDRDEHGCIGSAGYSWCEAKQKCLRTWEEACESTNTNIILNANTAANTNTTVNANAGTNTNADATATTYTSPAFGISFTYAKTDGGKNVLVKETNDTIYVYMEGTSYDSGQSVQIFTKDAATTLKTAIEQQFLTGYAPADCFVEAITLSGQTDPTWTHARITYPAGDVNAENPWANAEKCPARHTTTNGVSYFATNPALPTKFFYYRIGQYLIPADANDSDSGWQDTVQVTQ
jgi:hypothetical protein